MQCKKKAVVAATAFSFFEEFVMKIKKGKIYLVHSFYIKGKIWTKFGQFLKEI